MSKANPFPSLFKNDPIIKKTYFFVSKENKNHKIFEDFFPYKTYNDIFNSNNFINNCIINRVEEETKDYKNNNIFANDVKTKILLNNDKNEKMRRNNKKNESKEIIKCNHRHVYVAYCTSNNKNDGGLLCYDCLFKYHQDHISQCLPIIKKRTLHYYIKKYKQYIKLSEFLFFRS